MPLQLTKALIYAAAQDAAARSRRQRGLTLNDEESADAYHAEFDRLFESVGGPEGWLNLPKE